MGSTTATSTGRARVTIEDDDVAREQRLGDAVTILSYLRVLRTRWLLVFVGLVVGVASAGAFTALVPPTYEATVTLYVSSSSRGEGASAAYDASQLSEQRVKSYERLLTSPRITREVTDRLGLPTSPDDLASRIAVASESGTVLLSATVADKSADRAARIANTVGDSFTRLVTGLEQFRDPGQVPVVTVQVIEPASVPSTPVSPRPARDITLGIMVGLALGWSAALIRTALDTTVRSGETLAEATSAPNLGVLPRAAELGHVTEHDGFTPAGEALRTLRTNVQFLDVQRRHIAVVITSAEPQEGKTTVAAHLAVSFAATGRKVLLVEADLRRPRVADVFGMDREVGLTSLIAGRADLDDAVKPWRGDDLHVLPSGPIPSNPSELLVSPETGNVLGELAERYEVVILDAPPLLPVTDAAALSTWADGAILVCRFGGTTAGRVRSARDALEAVSSTVIGCVLTMAPSGETRRYRDYFRSVAQQAGPTESPSAGAAHPRSSWLQVLTMRTSDRTAPADRVDIGETDRSDTRETSSSTDESAELFGRGDSPSPGPRINQEESNSR